jgi:hypothetical protein
MSASQHIEWLGLIEKRGPFLAVDVLDDAFPQDLESVDTPRRQRVRGAYEEWTEAVENDDPQQAELHREWIKLILSELLEYQPEVLNSGDEIPESLAYKEPTSGTVVRPDYALCGADKTHLLIACYPPHTDLDAPLAGESWAASPIERMTNLCRATQVRVGMVTNGELWSIISAPADGSTSIGTWHARLWQHEPITLRAFVSLPGVRRFFGQPEGSLEALFAKSLENQDGVTETLGEQVRRAVEVLVQALDRADVDRDRTLLQNVSPARLYEAGLTVMMRLVVLLCAEERKLLLLGDPIYDQNYAASTLRSRLLEEKQLFGEEVLERRFDAWSRLLALFRAVYGGIEHEGLRLPPLGGSLFDPDRFPFLEGRQEGSTWTEASAEPLPIDNRTVLLLLEALQVLEQKAGAQLLTYEALDVEQIGHVYEGLLERTVTRVPEVTLGLVGSKKSVNPVIPLDEIEKLSKEGSAKLLGHLNELTGRSESAIKNALQKQIDDAAYGRLLLACGNDAELAQRVRPYASLLRTDSWGEPIVYPAGAFIVALGADRRATGSHYTPRSLTEPIVQHTLEPLVYVGPAEGKPESEWQLKSPAEILDLKVCDMAMGSAAFLVQTARYLGERLVESWDREEMKGNFISIDGTVLAEAGAAELMPKDKSERILLARRLVASRCLYGVDLNPMAVELAKVSLWLVTMMKNRPFGFLDHALKCGDALLGVSSVQQIENFSLRPGERQVTFATANLFRYVDEASAKRRALEGLPSNDHTQIETKNRLHAEAEAATAKVKALADCLIALELGGFDGETYEEARESEAAKVQALMARDAGASLTSPISNSQAAIAAHARDKLHGRRLFHWPLEFPEVFARNGFDVFVGNPPFLGGVRISEVLGVEYNKFLVERTDGSNRKADFCCYFFRRAAIFVRKGGQIGLIATNSLTQGLNRRVSLEHLCEAGFTITRAWSSFRWPGTGAVEVAVVHLSEGSWKGAHWLNGLRTETITPSLTSESSVAPVPLLENNARAYNGPFVYGEGFLLSKEEALELISADPATSKVILPYLVGQDINSNPEHTASRFIVSFEERTEAEAQKFAKPFALLKERVFPMRDAMTPQKRDMRVKTQWWKFFHPRLELIAALKSCSEVCARSRVSTHHAVTIVSSNQIPSEMVTVFLGPCRLVFPIIQSAIHEEWVWVNASSLGGLSNTRYILRDCFFAFPFPRGFWEQSFEGLQGVQDAGAHYFEFRRQIMKTRQEGLTKTYNRFHDPGEKSADIKRLRALHVEMDQVVAAVYGWSDLDLGHGFHPTKQGERYTLSEPARRTVLDRLLALNHQRYEEEVKASLHEKKKKPAAKRKSKAEVPAQETLL